MFDSAINIQSYWDMLSDADWTYQMSDDNRKFEAGQAAMARLQSFAKQSPEHTKLISAFWDYENRVTTERPTRPVSDHVKYHFEFEQKSGDWHKARLGLLTASSVDRILTPTLKVAANDAERKFRYDILAQRVTGHADEGFVSSAMLRGEHEETLARELYAKRYRPVKQCGFITNSKFGFTIGYSPDGLIDQDGLLETKSRMAKYQVETILDRKMPDEFMLQVQTGLLVSERRYCDFISYSNGMPMVVLRILPDPQVHAAIIAAATAFNDRLNEAIAKYRENSNGMVCADRIDYEEITA